MAPPWYVKALVQKTISRLPGSQRINRWMQEHVTGGVRLTDTHFADKFGHAADHVAHWHRYRGAPDGSERVLELGTGWYPIVPLCLFACGFGPVRSLDLRAWLEAPAQRLALRRLLAWRREGHANALEPYIDEDRWRDLQRLEAAYEPFSDPAFRRAFGLETVVGDARDTGWPDASVDFIVSNNTFEHIPEPVLRDILAEFRRLAAPGAVMSHFIDLSDHFAHADPSISIYHFLRYSPRAWARIDNDLQPQNRLRWPDYHALYDALGLPAHEVKVRPGDPAALAREPVHPHFLRHTPDQLAISHG